MIREMIPWYLCALEMVIAFLLGLTIDMRNKSAKDICRIGIILCAVVVMCIV